MIGDVNMTGSELHIGKKVKIIGDESDYTDQLHGCIGTIKSVYSGHCLVDVVDSDGETADWYIWNRNMVEADVEV